MDVIKLFAVEKANNNHFLALPDEQTKNAIDLIICGCVSEAQESEWGKKTEAITIRAV